MRRYSALSALLLTAALAFIAGLGDVYALSLAMGALILIGQVVIKWEIARVKRQRLRKK